MPVVSCRTQTALTDIAEAINQGRDQCCRHCDTLLNAEDHALAEEETSDLTLFRGEAGARVRISRCDAGLAESWSFASAEISF